MNNHTNNDKVLNVLSLEDSIPDFEIICNNIMSAKYKLNMLRVDREKDFKYALQNNKFDIILSDFKLPGFDAFAALKIVKEICPETPFICISGYIGEETAIDLIKNGAVDYILKDRLGRLTLAIKRAMDEANEKEIRIQAVKSLHESEARLNNLIKNLPGYVYRCKTDPNWTLIFISSGCHQITGYTSEEFIEQKIIHKSLVRDDYKDFLWTQSQLDQTLEKVFEQEYPIITKNNEIKWVWERGRIVYNENKQPIYIEGFITEITERKELENELAEHHATINGILESAAGPVFSIDSNYCYTTFNSIHFNTMKSIYGMEIEIGHNMLDYLTVNEDKEKAKKNIDRALQGEHFIDSAYSGQPGLKRLYFEISHNPIYNSNANIIGVSVFAQDITYRKQMELSILRNMKFTEKLLKSIPIPVFFKDANGKYLGCNDAFTNHSGFAEDYIKGKTMMDLWPGEQSEMFHQRDLETLAGENHLTYEAKIIDKEKRSRDVIFFKNVFYDENGNAAGIIGAFIDITDHKKTEDEKKYLLAAVQNTDNIMVVKDLDLRIISGNNAFLKAIGHNSIKTAIGKTDAEIWGVTEDIEPIKTYMEDERDAQKLFQGQYILREEPVILPDGEIRTLLTKKYPIFDDNGKLLYTSNISIDITEQKKIEEERKYLLASIENVADRIVVKDLNLKIVAANKSWLKGRGKNNIAEVFGMTDAEAFGVSVDTEPIRTYMEEDKKAQTLEQGEYMQSELPVKLFSGLDTICLVKRFPILDENGKVFCTGTIATDITEHKIEEEKLRKSEEKFRTVANYTNDWEFWIDQKGDFIYCSPSCERVTGYKANDFLQNSELLSYIVYKEDKELFELHKKVEDLAEQGHKEIQFRIVCKKNAIRWIGHVSRPVYSELGEFIGIRGSNRDITERKETELQLIISKQKYKLISENISDGVFICRNGVLEYTNIAMNRIFGYEDLQLKDSPLIQLIEQDSKGDLEEFLKYNGASNQTRNNELKCIKKDFSNLFIDMILNYVAAEKVIYGVAHDVTEKRQIQKKNIVKAIIQTEEKEKSYFSKELHDGLGPLLSTIKLYLQWSKRQNANELREEILQKAENILEEALITVTEISNKLSPHLLEDYGLSSAVLSFTKKLNETTLLKISFQSNLERRINIEIEAALYRAVIECINNTVKHAKANNIYIVIIDNGNFIQLNYKDDGIGFDIEKMILEQKGLGLFNLKNRIQTIGGNVKMISEPGAGVNYSISINC